MCLRHFSELFEGTSELRIYSTCSTAYTIYIYVCMCVYIYIYICNVYREREEKPTQAPAYVDIHTPIFLSRALLDISRTEQYRTFATTKHNNYLLQVPCPTL